MSEQMDADVALAEPESKPFFVDALTADIEIAGDIWIWVDVACRRYHINRGTIRNWIVAFPAGNYKPLTTLKVRLRGKARGPRVYIRKRDMELFVGTDQLPSEDSDWATLDQCINELGLTNDFLARYSDGGSSGRRSDFMPHPAIGRLIKTERKLIRRDIHIGGKLCHKTQWRVRWLRSDIDEIRNATAPDSSMWVRRAVATRKFGITESQLIAANKRNGRVRADKPGRIRRERFAVRVPGRSRPTPRWFYFVADLKAEAERLVKDRIKPEDLRRVYVDIVGGRWLMRTEVVRLLGVKSIDLHNWVEKGCKWLGGSKLLWKKFDRPDLRPFFRQPRTHYSEDQVLTIARAMGKLPKLNDQQMPLSPPRSTSSDGPISPNLIRHNDTIVEVQPIPWRLIDYLWKNRTAQVDDVVESVWATDASERAIDSAKSKANLALLKSGFPVSISVKNGHFVLS